MQKSVIVVCASSPCSLAEIASTVRQCLCTHARVNNQYMHVKKRTQNAGMMHSHVHTCTHTHIHTDVCASIHTYKQTNKHGSMHLYMDAHIQQENIANKHTGVFIFPLLRIPQVRGDCSSTYRHQNAGTSLLSVKEVSSPHALQGRNLPPNFASAQS